MTSRKTALAKSRRIALVCSAGLLGAVALAPPAQAQAAPFADTPTNHWAYEAVQNLAKRGIVIGYPDGTFGGKRPMTRYEFAVAIDRMLRTIDEMTKAAAGNTPPPPDVPTPARAGLTQDDLNQIQALIDKFRPELDTIQSDLKTAQDDIDALRTDVQDAKNLATKAQDTANNSYGAGANRKFTISGYIQARIQSVATGQGGRDRFPQGVPTPSGSYNGNYAQGGNRDSFELRRSRLKFTGTLTPNTKYGIQLDASGAITAGAAANQQVTVREGYVAYAFGDGSASQPTITAGLFATPFGYILPGSMSNSLSPERPLGFSEAGYGIFANQDYDKGVQFSYNTPQQLGPIPAGLKLTFAAINGTGRSSENTDRNIDEIYRVAYQSQDKALGLGISYYDGQIKTPALLAAPAAGTGSTYTGRKKELLGLDAQYISPAGPFVLAEYVGGRFEQRTAFQTTTNPLTTGLTAATTYAPGNKIDGYYVQGGYTFTPTGNHPLTFVVSYDRLNRAEGSGSGTRFGGESAFVDENIGYGVLYNLDKATRVRFYYNHPDKAAYNPQASATAGGITPHNYDLFTGELQVKF